MHRTAILIAMSLAFAGSLAVAAEQQPAPTANLDKTRGAVSEVSTRLSTLFESPTKVEAGATTTPERPGGPTLPPQARQLKEAADAAR